MQLNKLLLLMGLVALSSESFSQTKDTIPGRSGDSTSVPARALSFAADKISAVRPLALEFSHAAPYNFGRKRGDVAFPDGKTDKFDQFKVTINYNFLKRKNWMLGISAGYRFTSMETLLPVTGSGISKNNDQDLHYLYSSLNFTYFSTLFKKSVIYTSSFMVDGSEKHVERIKGLVTATMVLKANQHTKLLVGAFLNIDPTVQLPILPTFTYEHKFKNGLIADVLLPRNIYIRKFVFNRNGRISLGTEFANTTFYLYNIDGTNQKYEYRQTDLNNGLVYEHAIGKFIFVTKAGVRVTPSGRIFRKQDTFADPVYETTPAPAFYFNAGISLNPFTFFGKKK